MQPSVMTPEEAAAWCDATGCATPWSVKRAMEQPPGPPRSAVTLDMGERHGHAKLTAEFDATATGTWLRWMGARRDAMGGELSDVRPLPR